MPARGPHSSSPQDSESSRSLDGKQDAGTTAAPLEEIQDEYIYVDLTDIRKDVQCPICLGIIRKTRTVMECLHRFCRECIDKSMRLGNNECPVCRTHCASRRSLRDDLNFDALIAALYADIDSYEEEELALREEDTRRNRQLQATIAEMSARQSDAIARRCTSARGTSGQSMVRKVNMKIQRIQGQSKGRSQGQDSACNSSSPEDEDEFIASQTYEQTESVDEAHAEKRTVRSRKRKAPSYLLDDLVKTADSSDDADDEVVAAAAVALKQGKGLNKVEGRSCEEKREAPVGGEALVTWARGGARSHVRYGSLTNSSNNKQSQSKRATSLFDALCSAACLEKVNEFDVHFKLEPLSLCDSEGKLPILEKPNVCCSANVTVHHICMFLLARLFPRPTMELELVVGNTERNGSTPRAEIRRAMEVLHPNTTLRHIHTYFWDKPSNLVLMYRAKLTKEGDLRP